MEGMKAVIAAIVVVTMFVSSVSAANITVGGSTGWDLATNLADWSVSTSVFVNDSLLFIYTPAHDVIEVNEANFTTCVTSHPIGAYNDINGETLIILTKPGTRYFVCGRSNHCTLGLKVRVQVVDSPSNDDHTASSSAAHRDAMRWECGRLALTICLFAAICGTDFVACFWFFLHPFIRLFLGIMLAMSILVSLGYFGRL